MKTKKILKKSRPHHVISKRKIIPKKNNVDDFSSMVVDENLKVMADVFGEDWLKEGETFLNQSSFPV